MFDKSRNFVLVYQDAQHIARRKVDIYKTLNGVTYLNGGLQPGEKIVSQPQLLVSNDLAH